MKVTWDYSVLAKAYVKRPDYSADAISRLLATAGCGKGARACDVGAGAAHLTLALLDNGLLRDLMFAPFSQPV